MIQLVVEDYDQITLLEYELNKHGIKYDLVLAQDTPTKGVRPPCVIVDGVPLDYNRAVKWMRGLNNNE